MNKKLSVLLSIGILHFATSFIISCTTAVPLLSHTRITMSKLIWFLITNSILLGADFFVCKLILKKSKLQIKRPVILHCWDLVFLYPLSFLLGLVLIAPLLRKPNGFGLPMMIASSVLVILLFICRAFLTKYTRTISDQLFLNDHPMVDDIINDYADLRTKGVSSHDAVARIKNDRHEELNDQDDAPFVVIGIALALSQKQELTQQAQNDALAAAHTLKTRLMISEMDYGKIIEQLSNDRLTNEKA